MGIGMYIYATYFSHKGFMATGFIGPMPLLLILGYKGFVCLRNKRRLGTFINYQNSNLFDKDRNLKKKNLAPLIGNWYGNTAHVFLFTFAFKYAKLGGLNQGVIPIMTIFATIFNCTTFYFAFGETISAPQCFGMLIAVSCVIFLSLDSANKKGEIVTE